MKFDLQFFGGRGASSGGISGNANQNYMIDRIKNNAKNGDTIQDLKFSKGKNGEIKFTYTNGVTGEKNNTGTIDINGNVKYGR